MCLVCCRWRGRGGFRCGRPRVVVVGDVVGALGRARAGAGAHRRRRGCRHRHGGGGIAAGGAAARRGRAAAAGSAAGASSAAGAVAAAGSSAGAAGPAAAASARRLGRRSGARAAAARGRVLREVRGRDAQHRVAADGRPDVEGAVVVRGDDRARAALSIIPGRRVGRRRRGRRRGTSAGRPRAPAAGADALRFSGWRGDDAPRGLLGESVVRSSVSHLTTTSSAPIQQWSRGGRQ